jgi:intein/homing endonuclease
MDQSEKGKKISAAWTEKSMILIRRARNAPRESLGYILGVIASDGCVVSRKKGPCRIEMKTVNRSFAEIFYKKMMEVFGKASFYQKRNTSSYHSSRKSYPFVWVVELSSKLVPPFVESLLRNQSILSSSHDFKIGFLRGLYDGDGYVKRRNVRMYGTKLQYRRPSVEGVGLTSGDRSTLRVTQEILDSFGIKNVFEDTRKDCARVMIYRKADLERFASLIGFRVDYRARALSELKA